MINDQSNTNAAFSMLIDELNNEIKKINQSGAKYFEEGEYDSVENAKQFAKRYTEIREKILKLEKEYEELVNHYNNGNFMSVQRDIFANANMKNYDQPRLCKGKKTPEEVYYYPILKTLDEMGGSGRIADVLRKVQIMVMSVLNEYDLETLPSNDKTQRWYNTAQWARNTLVEQGLLKRNSPHGIWEITSQGKEFVRNNQC